MNSRIQKARRAFSEKNLELARKSHDAALIQKQIHENEHAESNSQYLGEFVYGAMDGTITTFAVVAGATGASLSPGVVLVLGFANLLGDGFSMASGSYLSEKADQDYVEKERKREEWEIETVPEGEREEIRQIFKKKGFKGKDLEKAVKIITSDKKVWVDTMMADELGLIGSAKRPFKTALSTFLGFIIIGVIPLLTYIFSFFSEFFRENSFPIAIGMTIVALITIGVIKAAVVKKELWKSVVEALFVGGAAAIIAYYVGLFLRWVVAL
ncbi:MAG TPA: VIT1/CCC1 transporter family protein [Candidatus Nanoarchaeia archaeon]|nr:VIT1/CCC1 transporter family protein [Candidatus Nanoarchaeia archaeon]